jgi:hypothetical protein
MILPRRARWIAKSCIWFYLRVDWTDGLLIEVTKSILGFRIALSEWKGFLKTHGGNFPEVWAVAICYVYFAVMFWHYPARLHDGRP